MRSIDGMAGYIIMGLFLLIIIDSNRLNVLMLSGHYCNSDIRTKGPRGRKKLNEVGVSKSITFQNKTKKSL